MNRMCRVLRRGLTAMTLLLCAPAALALTCSADVQDLSFGNVDVLSGGTPLASSSARVTVTCRRGLLELDALGDVTVCVGLGPGTGGLAADSRQLLSGGNRLRYNLYSDAAGSVPWGSYSVFTASGPRRFVLSLPVLVLEDTETATLYGRVSGSQSDAAVGSYVSAFSGQDTEVRYGRGNVSCSALSASNGRAPFTVDATVMPNCSIAADPLDFGSTPGLASALDAAGRITSTCTRGAAYQIGLDSGQHAQGSQRRMVSGSEVVRYELYRDAARSLRWGLVSGSEAITGMGSGVAQQATVYGRVPAQTGMAAGSYSDTVVAIISF